MISVEGYLQLFYFSYLAGSSLVDSRARKGSVLAFIGFSPP